MSVAFSQRSTEKVVLDSRKQREMNASMWCTFQWSESDRFEKLAAYPVNR